MGKRKHNMKPGNKKARVRRDDNDDVDPTSNDFMLDEIDSYHDDGNIMINKKAKKSKKKVEEEVFGLGSLSDEDDGEGFLNFGSEDEDSEMDKEIDMGSDIEEKDDKDDALPSDKAWGRRTKNFYKTDFVDQDWSGGFTTEDQEIAEMEEQEALALQKKMAEELNAADFDFGLYEPQEQKTKVPVREEKVERDFSSMTQEECIELLKQESPELLPLIKDNKCKAEELTGTLQPLMDLLKGEDQVLNSTKKYVCLRHHIVTSYLTNLQFYFLLKSKRAVVVRHPVMKRLAQYRKLLELLSPADEVLQTQMENLVKYLENKKAAPLDKLRKTTESYLRTSQEDRKGKKRKKVIKTLDSLIDESDQEKNESEEEQKVEDDDEEEGVAGEQEEEREKRGITYQIAKNKGLTPYRKKEYKNPRVKHRIKFSKALKRRKGAVRTPRTEKERYGGEISGIRAGVVKSVKF